MESTCDKTCCQLGSHTSSLSLSLYRRFVFMMVTGFAVVIVSVQVLGRTLLEPPNPFAPYADILPRQLREALTTRGFHCQFTLGPSLEEFCSLSPENGTFSAIQVTIFYETGRVRRKVIFRVRDHMLVLGHLARLWGKPQTVIYGSTVYFRWPNMHIVTVLQGYNGRFSYWLPITYVTFESAN